MSSNPYNTPGGSRHGAYDPRNVPPPAAAYTQSYATPLPSIRDLHPSLPWTPPAPAHHSPSEYLSIPGPSPHLPPPNVPPALHVDDSTSDPYNSSPSFERKRNRASYSCTECKRRKIRCDRNIPCQPCKKRRESYNCRMSDGPTTSEGGVTRRDFNDLESRYIDLDYRFSELEKVLSLLLEAVAEGHLPTPSETNAMRTRISSLSARSHR